MQVEVCEVSLYPGQTPTEVPTFIIGLADTRSLVNLSLLLLGAIHAMENFGRNLSK